MTAYCTTASQIGADEEFCMRQPLSGPMRRLKHVAMDILPIRGFLTSGVLCVGDKKRIRHNKQGRMLNTMKQRET